MQTDEAWADAVVGELLEREWLVLVSARSRPSVTAAVAALLGDDVTGGAALAEALIDHPGVADLTCDDDELEAVVRAAKPRPLALRAAPAPAPSPTSPLVPHSRSETDERVMRVFGAAAPRQTVTIAEKPAIGDQPRYAPAPPLYFVIDLQTSGPVTRKDLFVPFTQAWFQGAAFPRLCGRDVGRDEVVFVGTPASEAVLASRGIRTNPTYDPCWFAVATLREGAPRAAADFQHALAAVLKAAPSWSPAPRVAPATAAKQASALVRVAKILERELRVTLVAPEEGFLGRSVWNLLHSVGLRWGDMDLFNWETAANWSDCALFWVGTSTEPGFFLPEEIVADKRYADLVFGMDIGSKPQPETIAKAMIAFATAVKEKLGGTLRTSKGEDLDAPTFVREVIRVHADLEAKGFPPGAPDTLELGEML